VSFCIIWPERERVLIGTDTAAGETGEGRCSKMFPLVHAGAVLACLGTTLFGSRVLQLANYECADFDTLLTKATDVVARAHHYVVHEHENQGRVRDKTDGVFSAFVGWSKAGDSMAVRVVVAGAGGMNVWNPQPGRLVYSFAFTDHTIGQRLRHRPVPKTVEAMARFAQMEMPLLRRSALAPCVGGQFIITEITRDAMTVRAVGEP
jgi:hypothetical protein